MKQDAKLSSTILTAILSILALDFQNIVSVSPNLQVSTNKINVVLPTCCDLKGHSNSNGICNKDQAIDSKGKGRKEIHIPWEWELPSEISGLGLEFISKFLLNVKDLNCKTGGTTYLNYTFGDLDPSNPKLQIDSLGYVHWKKSRFEIDYFHINQYCIDGITDMNIIIKTCPFQCNRHEPCIQKCCPLNTIFNPQPQMGCINETLQWTPKFFKDPTNPETVYDPIPIVHGSPRYVSRSPPSWARNCVDGQYQLLTYDQNVSDIIQAVYGIQASPVKFRLGPNGKLNLRNINSRQWEELSHENYCIDGLKFSDGQIFKNTLEDQGLFICVLPSPKVVQKPVYYGGLAIFASTFALLTVISYSLLFETQNIHGWTIMSHSSSVFLFFISIGIAHLTNTEKSSRWVNSVGCQINATFAHYLFISTFCWLLLISFDLWFTFRSLTTVNRGKGLRRFLYYSLFGWGLPLGVIVISWILEYKFKNDENSTVPVPLYGEGYCYVGNGSHLYYIYIPISILMGLNLFSFILTSISLIRLQQSAKFARENINREKQSYVLFLKLFIVVGALWIFEIISFYASGGHIEWYWQIFDSLNLLQPVAIFWIFVVKWEMINSLYNKYRILKPFLYPIRQVLIQFQPELTIKTTLKSLSNQKSKPKIIATSL